MADGNRNTNVDDTEVASFLEAWLGVRQLIQAANFNNFHRAGLSATQFMTLNLLPATGAGLTLTELARALNLSAATVTKTIDSLEERKLVRRTPATADRRRVMLRLTPAGKRLHNAASADFHQYIGSLFRSLQPQQRQALIGGLQQLTVAGRELAGKAGAAATSPVGRPPTRQAPTRAEGASDRPARSARRSLRP